MALGEENGVDTTSKDPGFLLLDRVGFGEISSPEGDLDYSRVTLGVGSYTFRFDGSEYFGGPGIADLSVEIYDLEGILLATFSGASIETTFTVDTPQEFRLKVSSQTAGGYAISASHLPGEADDVGGDNATAAAAGEGVTYYHQLEDLSDIDAFRVDLVAGVRYLMLGTSEDITDVILTVEGHDHIRKFFKDVGTGGTHEFFTATESGSQFLTVSSCTFLGTGAYSLYYQATLTPDLPVVLGSAAADEIAATVASELWGWDGNDVLRGSSEADWLTGGAGADRMVGGLGDDFYFVDDAGDRVEENAGAGADKVRSSISHALAANVENLTLTGSATANGGGNTLANVLRGNAAANVLNGGAAADQLIGGLGNDTYVVDNRGDCALEGAGQGTDLVRSSVTHALAANVENLTLTGAAAINGTGNAAANVLRGNGAANVLNGGAGNDLLVAGLGGDRLIGGAGADRLAGGLGADVFVFAAAGESGRGAARDVILDFAAGDRLHLRGVDADSLHAGNQAFEFIGAHGFSGDAGELRYQGGLLSGDLNGDRAADFELAIGFAPAVGDDMLL